MSPQSGLAVQGIAFLLLVIGVGLSVLYYTFGQVVPPGSMGVRQITAGPGQGYSETGTKPGLFWSIPFYSKIHLVPRTLQLLHFHRATPSTTPGDAIGLEVKTSDGSAVDVDISVLYKFYDEAKDGHGGPRDLFENVGSDRAAWERQVQGVASDELRRALGSLRAAEFYEVHARSLALDSAKDGIDKRLAPFGMAAEAILLRRYTYRDDRIDEAIFNKNLQDQEEKLKESSGKLAEVKATLEQVSAEWDAKIETLKVNGENEARVIHSEANLIEAEKRGEGDLLVAKAVAEVDRLKAGALAKSQGASVYIARAIAPLLSSLKGGVVSNIDPYDLQSWSDKLGAKRGDQ